MQDAQTIDAAEVGATAVCAIVEPARDGGANVSPCIEMLFACGVAGIKPYTTAAIRHYKKHPGLQTLTWGKIILRVRKLNDHQLLTNCLDHLEEQRVL